MCATCGASWNKLVCQYAAVAHGVSRSVTSAHDSASF